MLIGQRIRELRKLRGFTQGDLELHTGLFKSYTSRIENGHAVPQLVNLEKYSRALGVPLYLLFYGLDDQQAKPVKCSKGSAKGRQCNSSGQVRDQLDSLRRYLSHMSEHNRRLLLDLAQRFSKRDVIRKGKIEGRRSQKGWEQVGFYKERL